MSVEIEGEVSSSAGQARRSQGVGLDNSVLIDLSRVSFLSSSPQFLTKVVHIPPGHPFRE